MRVRASFEVGYFKQLVPVRPAGHLSFTALAERK